MKNGLYQAYNDPAMKHKISRKTSRPFLTLCASLALCSCGGGSALSDGKPLPRLTFAHLAPLKVNVGRVDIVDASAGNPLPVGFVADPAQVAQRYFGSRFQAAGTQGTLFLRLEEASVVHEFLPSGEKIARALKVGGADRYTVRVKMVIEHRNDRDRLLYSQVLTGTRVMNISEYASPAEREAHQMQGLETLFREIDSKIPDMVLHGMRIGVL